MAERRIYGKTGEVGKDGILTPDQIFALERTQHEATDKLLDALGRRAPEGLFPMVHMATGIGKGKIIHNVIDKFRRDNRDPRILVIAGTKNQLVEQTQDALVGYQSGEIQLFPTPEAQDTIDLQASAVVLDDDVDLDDMDMDAFAGYSVGKFGDKTKTVQVTTLQGVQRRHIAGRLDLDEFDLVIVDEVHNAGTRPRYDAIKGFKNVVGFTATAHRSSGAMKAPEDYGFEIVHSLTLPEAQEEGLLPPLYGMQINTAQILDQIPTTARGKIDYRKLEQLLKKHPDLYPFIVDQVAPIITTDGKKLKTMVATNWVWEAEIIAKLFKAKGISVGLAVNSKAAKALHTDEIPTHGSIDRYFLPEEDENSIQVLVSPRIGGEGFDAPFTEALLWASPTDSALRYTQYTGRLARRAPGKAYGVAIDCMYQTAQYAWTMNFGMWMKDNVRDLGDGVFYLGPEGDPKDITDIKRMRNLTDAIPLGDAKNSGKLPLQENDVPIHARGIVDLFVGHWYKLRPLVDKVRREWEAEDPEGYAKAFAQRLNRSKTVEVCTDRQQFIVRMVKAGATFKDKTRKEMPELKDGEIPVTRSLSKTFIGDQNVLVGAAEEVRREWEAEDPEGYAKAFAERKGGGNKIVEACTDPEEFTRRMAEKGIKVRPKEVERPKPGETILTDVSLRGLFVGSWSYLSSALTKAKASWREEDPEGYEKAFALRKAGRSAHVEVCLDRASLIYHMSKAGVKLRDNSVQAAQEGEIRLAGTFLKNVYVGQEGKLGRVAEEVRREWEAQDPEGYAKAFAERRSGPHFVTVCTDQTEFTRRMAQKGVRVRPS